jgi:hypothetical protein
MPVWAQEADNIQEPLGYSGHDFLNIKQPEPFGQSPRCTWPAAWEGNSVWMSGKISAERGPLSGPPQAAQANDRPLLLEMAQNERLVEQIEETAIVRSTPKNSQPSM